MTLAADTMTPVADALRRLLGRRAIQQPREEPRQEHLQGRDRSADYPQVEFYRGDHP